MNSMMVVFNDILNDGGVCDLLSSYDRLLLHIITILIVLVSLFYFFTWFNRFVLKY